MSYSTTFDLNLKRATNVLLAGAVLSSGLLLAPALPQSAALPANASPAAKGTPYHYRPNPVSRREGLYYGLVWGIESLGVKSVESGEIIRFRYRVIDPDKARPLNDKKSEPSLIDPQAQVKLVVPSLEQVGQLRQSATPEAGKSYWMAFSNKGRYVKRGDRVTVMIGKFRAVGLVVE